MAERHTPGPWQYLGTDVTDGPVITTTVPGVIDDDEVLGTSEWCRLEDADGRLMAAAPELLRALRLCARALERQDSGHPYIADAVSAIAKATGEDND